MAYKIRISKGLKYYYYGNYNTWKEAYNLARFYQRKNKKNRYLIDYADYKYYLYMTKVRNLGYV